MMPENVSHTDPLERLLSAVDEEFPHRPTPDPLIGQVIDRYKLLQRLPEGGMGVVYRALDLQENRLVALKTTHGGSGINVRFENEAQALRTINHPNVVRIWDTGRFSARQMIGQPFIVMEWVEGGSLADRTTRRWSARDAAILVCTIATAVQFVHQQGILHRDLKPANILMTPEDQPKVADFGLAKLAGNDVTASGALLGTPNFMSPEQAAGERADRRSDVYGLGAILGWLITGEPPFPGRTPVETLEAVRTVDPAPLQSVRPDIPPDLNTIYLKCMAKNPAKRYSTAQELAADLQRFVDRRPILARPAPWHEHLRKWAKRHPTGASLGGVAALAVLVLAAFSIYISSINTRLSHSLDEVTQERNKKEQALIRESERAKGEEQAKKEALQRESEAKSMLDFVETRILAAARPEGQEGGLGKDVSLRRAIDSALPFLISRFAEHPLVEARLSGTLAHSLAYLGDQRSALALRQRAQLLYERQHGTDHPSVLKSKHNVAMSLVDLGELDAALRLYEAVFPAMKSQLGPDSPDTLACMNSLAICYRITGHFDDAIRLCTEARDRCKRTLGDDHVLTLQCMSSEANCYYTQHRDEEAIAVDKSIIAVLTDRKGENHPETLAIRHNHALSLARLGRFEEARLAQEEVLNRRQAVLDRDHPDVARSMNSLAFCYAALGRHEESGRLCEQALAIRRVKLGPGHHNTLESMNNLALSLSSQQRHEEAARLFQETLKLRKLHLGEDNPGTLETMKWLARCYTTLRRFPDALVMWQEFCGVARTKYGERHREVCDALYDIACIESLMVPDAKEAESQAKAAVQSLIKATATGYRNLSHIKKDPDLNPLRNRQVFAEHVAELESAMKLRASIWAVVRKADSTPEEKQTALVYARRASAIVPLWPEITATLGAVQYSAGEYAEAVQTLLLAEEQAQRYGSGANTLNWSFIAMARWKLGEQNEAHNALARAKSITSSAQAVPKEWHAALREAELVLQGN